MPERGAVRHRDGSAMCFGSRTDLKPHLQKLTTTQKRPTGTSAAEAGGGLVARFLIRASLPGFNKVLDGRDNVLRRIVEIRLQVALTYHTLLGLEIDEDKRPPIEESDSRDHLASGEQAQHEGLRGHRSERRRP